MSKETIKNIDELLQIFVCKDEDRPKFMKPWSDGRYVFASETHILIRVPSELTSNDYPATDIKTSQLFPKCDPTYTISMAQLSDTLAKVPLIDEMERVGEDITCDECDGTGEVYWDYKTWSKEFDCPCCDGTGYISTSELKPTGNKIVDPDKLVLVGLRTHKAIFLSMLLDAMKFFKCAQATVAFGQPFRGTLFSLSNNIDILIMPTTVMQSDIACKLNPITNQP